MVNTVPRDRIESRATLPRWGMWRNIWSPSQKEVETSVAGVCTTIVFHARMSAGACGLAVLLARMTLNSHAFQARDAVLWVTRAFVLG